MDVSEKTLRNVAAAIMGLSLLGLADAGYLTAHKLFGVTLQCGASSGCETVAQSAYSSVFGIPLSLLGMFFYLTMFFGALIYREFVLEKALTAVSILSIVSILTSAWLVGVQLFILKAICIYCMISAGLSLILVNLGIHALLTMKRLRLKTSAPGQSPDANG